MSDLQTCLMWEKKTGDPGQGAPRHCGDPEADCTDPHHVLNRYPGITSITKQGAGGAYQLATSPSEPVASSFLSKLNAPPGFAGYTDWRLPATAGDPRLHLEANGDNADPELESILWGCESKDACLLPNANGSYWSSSVASGTDSPLCVETRRRIDACNPFDHLPARAVRSIRQRAAEQAPRGASGLEQREHEFVAPSPLRVRRMGGG